MANIQISDDQAVRTLTITRPECHNCIDSQTAAEIAGAIRRFADDDDVRVLIVTGSGERSFSSGWDLKSSGDLGSYEHLEEAGPLGFARLEPGKPTIAAVNGYCFAGGFELALWCDFRVVAENAEFGVLNRRWGVPLIDGGTQRLARIAGLGNALYLIQTGARIDAARALRMGIAQEIVAKGRALERSIELANIIAAYPQASLLADRKAAIRGWGLELKDGIMLEARLGLATLGEEEMAAGLDRFGKGDRPEAPR